MGVVAGAAGTSDVVLKKLSIVGAPAGGAMSLRDAGAAFLGFLEELSVLLEVLPRGRLPPFTLPSPAGDSGPSTRADWPAPLAGACPPAFGFANSAFRLASPSILALASASPPMYSCEKEIKNLL